MLRHPPCAIVDTVNERGQPAVLLVSASWRIRALLAAQIGESLRQDVISASDVNQALELIKLGGIEPVVLVVDAGMRVGVGDVKRLTEAKRDTPLVLVVSRLRRQAFEELRSAAAAYLVRPVDIGEIARSVRRALGDAAA